MSTDTSHETSITVTDAGPSLKKISIEVPAEAVAEKLGDSLDTLSSEAELPGFRKGRAPRRLIERRFGTAIRDEAKNQIISSAYQEAIEKHELKVIGDPSSPGTEELELKDGESFKFEIEVEVLPDFDLPSLEGIEIKRPTFAVEDDAVQGEIDRIKINEGDLEDQDTPENGDYLTGHGIMVGTVDGEEKTFHDIPGAVVQIPEDGGKGMILGVVVEDFGKQLGHPKPGETAAVKVTGPESHENEEVRGTDLTVTFEVERVSRIIPAELDDVLARYGMEGEEQLRETIQARLNERVLVRQQVAMRSQVSTHLIDSVEMDLPERLSSQQAERNIHRQRLELQYRGVPEDEVEQQVAEHRSASAERTARDLKMFFILSRAAEALDVKVEQAEVNARIAQMAMERGQRPEQLHQQLTKSGAINSVAVQVRDHKTFDAIIAKASIEDISPEEFEKLESADA